MYVYFIQESDRGCIKIGVTTKMEYRLAGLRVGNPFSLSIVGVGIGTRVTERALHRRFANYRLEGEWFEPCEELENLIKEFPTWEEYQAGASLPVCDSGNEIFFSMYREGCTMESIATALGITRQAVEQKVQTYGLERRRPPRKMTVKSRSKNS